MAHTAQLQTEAQRSRDDFPRGWPPRFLREKRAAVTRMAGPFTLRRTGHDGPPRLFPPPRARGRGLVCILALLLEKLRVLWRLVHDRKFVSQQQLFFAIGKIDEIGRMTGGWLKSLDARKA